jgi:hypothetical protein
VWKKKGLSGTKKVKSADLVSLLVNLTDPTSPPEEGEVRDFIYTYTSFTTVGLTDKFTNPKQLLTSDLLLQLFLLRYKGPSEQTTDEDKLDEQRKIRRL